MELSNSVQGLSVHRTTCMQMDCADNSEAYKTPGCSSNNATERTLTTLLDLVNLLCRNKKCEHLPILLMRELKGATLRFLKSEDALMDEVWVTSSAFGYLCRMAHDAEVNNGVG